MGLLLSTFFPCKLDLPYNNIYIYIYIYAGSGTCSHGELKDTDLVRFLPKVKSIPVSFSGILRPSRNNKI
jgi:hypothetical protein